MKTTNTSQNKVELIGISSIVLGWELLVHLPILFFSLELIQVNLSDFSLGFIVSLFGSIVILSTLIVSFPEDWKEGLNLTQKDYILSTIFFSVILLIGFFGFFLIEPIMFADFIPLQSQQRFLGALSFGIIFSLLGYFTPVKLRDIFG